MDPRDFLQLATDLCARGRPAELRAAVGRAYYAVYNVAAQMLRDWGYVILRNSSGHGEVMRYLSNSGDADLIRVGYQMSSLRSRRNAADYDLTSKDTEDVTSVRSFVSAARNMIDTIERCHAPARAAAIKAALDAYRRAIAPRPPPPP